MQTTEANSFSWDDLKYFLAASRTGSIRGAAESIQVNHTTLARRISVLEDRIGSRLFDRSTQGLALTQLGEELLPYALKVEEEMDAAARAIVGKDTELTGTINVTMPHWFSMSSIMDDIAEFATQHPEISLNLSLTDDIANLARREADVSVRVADEVTDNVVGRKLVPLSWAAYCSRGYAAGISKNGGEGLQFIGWENPETDPAIQRAFATYYPKAKLRHRVSGLVAMGAAASSGLGMAYLACNIGDRNPNLVRAPFQKPRRSFYVWLLLHRDLRNTARVRLFVDFIAERTRARKNKFLVAGTETDT